MPGTFHPNPNDVTPVPASEDRPRRISIAGGAKGKVFYGSSVADAHKEVEFGGDGDSYVDIAQPVFLVTDSNTVVVEGLAPLVREDGVAEENFDTDVKVHSAKEPAKKDQQKVAEKNENDSVPSFSGSSEPPPRNPASVSS